MTTNIHFNANVFTTIKGSAQTASPSIPIACPIINIASNPSYGRSLNNLAGDSFPTSTTQTRILLEFYKGTMPTDFSSFTDNTQRSSDLLISMPFDSSLNANYLELTSTNSRMFQIGISAVLGGTATASGVATWFLLFNNYGTTTTKLTTNAAIMGTIGLVGSGADMEIVDTNIVSGNSYKSNGFVLKFPYDMTY